MAEQLSVEERTALLERHIRHLVRRGYRVTSRTEVTAQLVKPKEFSLLWALIWLGVTLCVCGLGILFYLLYYLVQKDKTIYLEVDPYGQASVTPQWARQLIEDPGEAKRGEHAVPVVLGVAAAVAAVGLSLACCLVAALMPEYAGYPGTATSTIQTTRTETPTGTTVPVSPAASAASATPSPLAYVVQSGDTLSSIAADFGTTVDAIMHLNGLTSTTIYSGTQLLIPGQQSAALPDATAAIDATASEAGLIVDVPSILGQGIAHVEEILGPPVEAWRAGEPGSPLAESEGGEWRVYREGQYLIDAVYDARGVMCKFILGASYEHLQDEGYRLDSSALRLLDRLGMTAHLPHREPDRQVGDTGGAQVWHWYDADGYVIIMMAHPETSHCVYLVEIRQ
jgi:LysM repeat protein